MIDQARAAIRTSTWRRRLQAVAAGETDSLAIDINERGADVADLIGSMAAELEPGSLALGRLTAAFENCALSDMIVSRLSATDPAIRVRSAHIVGALRMEHAVPWLAPLLTVGDRPVREAAARALGKIGGVRSAEALMRAINSAGPGRVLIVELARAAPDLFLESVLRSPQRAGVRWAAAVAAGLRRRRPSVEPLIGLLATGSWRERATSCKALGWTGYRSAIPAVSAALDDGDARVRASAQKALIALLVHAPFGGEMPSRVGAAR